MAYTSEEEAKRLYQLFNGLYRTGEQSGDLLSNIRKEMGL